MKKYHVHVYKIEAMGEVDLEADNEEKARAKALRTTLKFGKSDCEFMALEFIKD